MKRVLIISPHFPPVNAADMHRVRQMLPFLQQNGWQAEIITVDPAYIESYSNDPLLLKTIPSDTQVHSIRAWNVKYTRKIGLGSLSMRSYFQFKKKGDELLRSGKFHLIFFSTTAFHVMALGSYWKRKFNVPFVLDIQDPWRNDFYLDKPKNERPPKFMIAYTIDKFLEAKTIPFADAIISVSKAYCETFQHRYPKMKANCYVVPFGGVPEDFKVVTEESVQIKKVKLKDNKINIVYVGRGGHDMGFAVRVFFKAINRCLERNQQLFEQIHCWFIGTSYALEGTGGKTIEPIAIEENLGDYVTEITDRIPYFETLALLKNADVLFVPGSTDTGYTASKIYPYILAEKPLLACFHENSSVLEILQNTSKALTVRFASSAKMSEPIVEEMSSKLNWLVENRNSNFAFNAEAFLPYTSDYMTKRITEIFMSICK